MILFCDCLWGEELLWQCHRVFEPSVQFPDSSADSEDVYFHFGGAAMCSMLHNKCAKIKNCVLSQKDKVSQEITVLQQLGVHQKEDKAGYLKYCDEGHKYFPCTKLLPFLKAVDIAISKKVNDATLRQEGSDVLTAVVESVHSDQNLHSLFVTATVSKVPRLSFTAVDIVYKEMVQNVSYQHPGFV